MDVITIVFEGVNWLIAAKQEFRGCFRIQILPFSINL